MSPDVVLIHGSSSTAESWAPIRAYFNRVGWTVHTPTLRHHDRAASDQGALVAGLSIRDYAADIAYVARGLQSPLIGGCSLGGLIGQLVAASTPTRGLFCLAPAPVAGIRGPLSALRVFGHHFLQGAPWRKPLRPPTWKAFRRVEAAAQDEATAREMHSGHGLFESGRAYCEIVFPFLDRGHATRVDHSAVSVPVLVVGGTRDRLTSPRVCRQTAARYSRGEYAEIEGADHMLTGGKHLPTVMEHLDRWIHVNRLAHDGAHP